MTTQIQLLRLLLTFLKPLDSTSPHTEVADAASSISSSTPRPHSEDSPTLLQMFRTSKSCRQYLLLAHINFHCAQTNFVKLYLCFKLNVTPDNFIINQFNFVQKTRLLFYHELPKRTQSFEKTKPNSHK